MDKSYIAVSVMFLILGPLIGFGVRAAAIRAFGKRGRR